MSAIPTRVRIGPIDYTVREVRGLKHAGNDVYGLATHDKAIIQIRAEMDRQAKMQTLWHEVVHAIAYQADINRLKVGDERAIDSLAWGIMQVVRDNPGLSRRAWDGREGGKR